MDSSRISAVDVDTTPRFMRMTITIRMICKLAALSYDFPSLDPSVRVETAVSDRKKWSVSWLRRYIHKHTSAVSMACFQDGGQTRIDGAFAVQSHLFVFLSSWVACVELNAHCPHFTDHFNCSQTPFISIILAVADFAGGKIKLFTGGVKAKATIIYTESYRLVEHGMPSLRRLRDGASWRSPEADHGETRRTARLSEAFGSQLRHLSSALPSFVRHASTTTRQGRVVASSAAVTISLAVSSKPALSLSCSFLCSSFIHRQPCRLCARSSTNRAHHFCSYLDSYLPYSCRPPAPSSYLHTVSRPPPQPPPTMVSSRHNRPAAQRDRPSFNDLHKYHAQNDLESGGRSTSVSNGRHPLPPRFRFRDAIATTMDMQDVNKLKEALRDGIDQGSLEKFLLSDDELKHIKNKKVRAFYKEQNERLDDWLEVDALVMAMADDVLDSMNPRDLDHDGIAEAGGALQATSESVEPLLPDEEREKRRKARRNAKWAINVSWRSIPYHCTLLLMKLNRSTSLPISSCSQPSALRRIFRPRFR